MCGIGGFFGQHTVAAATTAAMLDQLRRRGPDAQHVVGWDANWAPAETAYYHALLHARLSIIDPRPEADQPMCNDSGDIWICYNGEVYGWQQDRAELERLGYRFRTRSDTEFILRGYEAWGLEGLLPKLRGMFALVILDQRTRTVWAARDRIGLKPLVYYHHAREFGFASTVRALLPYLPPERRGLSPEALDAYLAHRYVPAPRTIFQDVKRLENGHWLRFDLETGQLEKRCYWQPQTSGADWRATLDDAIRLRTVADRPLGVFLSSGVDSSVIATRLSAMGYQQLSAFTAAFPGSKFDESEAADAIAARLHLPHRAVVVPETITREFATIVADLDEPFADPSSFPTWYLARATTREVKVVLGGDGGDELFAGYKRVAKHLRSRWRAGLRLPLPILPNPDSKGIAKLLTEAAVTWEEAYTLRFSGFTPNQRRFLQPDFTGGRLSYWRAPDETNDSRLGRLLAIDRANYLPEYILRKADLCTMAHGLELRAPLLDHRLFEALLSVPTSQRYTTPPKRMLAPLLEPIGELSPFYQKKRGFNPPLTKWLREDLAPKLDGLGRRLEELTQSQIAAHGVDTIVGHYGHGASHLAEQVLQLVVLDESLSQLGELAVST